MKTEYQIKPQEKKFHLGGRGEKFCEWEARIDLKRLIETYHIINDIAGKEQKENYMNLVGNFLEDCEKKGYEVNEFRVMYDRYNSKLTKLVEAY